MRHLPKKKLATKFNKVSWWALWAGDPRNFHNSFLIKNYDFASTADCSPEKRKQNLLTKDANHLKIAWHGKRQKNTLKKEKRKKKNEKKSDNNNKYIFTWTFLYSKIYILLEKIFGETSFILLHLYYSFFVWQVIGSAVVKENFWCILYKPYILYTYCKIYFQAKYILST